MLRDLDLQPVYDSCEWDLVEGLVVPLLRESVSYFRGVGFFSSGWLRLASVGLAQLIENGGQVRVVLSPILDARDWEAMRLGGVAWTDELLAEKLRRDITELGKSLESDTLNCLAWMVADRVLEFRFAVPRPSWEGGDYHDKVWLFTDRQGDCVALHGSINDSIKGSLNGEAISLFKSWEPGQEAYTQQHRFRLEQLWANRNPQLVVYTIPEVADRALVQLRKTSERPYRLPSVEGREGRWTAAPRVPFTLWEKQTLAISNWLKAGRRGILEMATGTGKTATALAAAAMKHQEDGRLAVIILVPLIHLVDQWREKCKEFGFSPLACSSAHGEWQRDLAAKVSDFRLGLTNSIVALAVHDTAATARFRSIVEKLPAERTLLIADEVHALGAQALRAALLQNCGFRLGLSATPQRWFDPEGTAAVMDYFGGVCFRYPLEEAIGTELTPYDYFPVPIELSDSELETYEALTAAIGRLFHARDGHHQFEARVKKLLRDRVRILWTASAKLPRLVEMLGALKAELALQKRELSHTLVYAAPGGHREVLRAVSALGLRCREFVHTVGKNERRRVLSEFGEGALQLLVAIRCLDEGVDVPATRIAFFLASTSNPRQFIQRRGRVLRKSQGKTKATLFDFVVVPPLGANNISQGACESLLRREMPRFAEFASAASNCFAARKVLRPVLDHFQMLQLLDEKPWVLYQRDHEAQLEQRLCVEQ